MLVYRVPREPSRLRATVWRRLKGLGAVYLQNSVAVLPTSAVHERALRALRREIVEMDGTAQVIRCDVVAGDADVVGAYNAARNEEYEEIVGRCQDFLLEIERETRAGHLTYAELEENDEDLVKLRGWLEKVTARDVADAGGRQAAVDALDHCAKTLEQFANRVYEAEDSQ